MRLFYHARRSLIRRFRWTSTFLCRLKKMLLLLFVSFSLAKQFQFKSKDYGSVAVPDESCKYLSSQLFPRGASSIDVAITAALCSGIVNPYASGIGGGGLMTIRSKIPSKIPLFFIDGGVVENDLVIDCRETAPESSFPEMFANASSSFGGLAIAVPGELWCLKIAHDAFGIIPWSILLKRVVDFAKTGFTVKRNLAWRLRKYKHIILRDPVLRESFAPKGILLKEGETCFRNRLANFLDEIANYGINVFYDGSYAESMINSISKNGGIFTIKDLNSYRPVIKKPLYSTFRNYKYMTPPPPSSGAILIAMLNIIENFSLNNRNATSQHVLLETTKFGQAMKTLMADSFNQPDIIKDVLKFIDKEIGEIISHKIDLYKTYKQSFYGLNYSTINEHGTCHISAISQFDSVSFTTTINDNFGSFVTDFKSGIVFNNQMDDFSIPGTADSLGNPSNPRNFPRPGQKPLSSMVPTILWNDDVIVSIGGSGGHRILPSVFFSIVNLIEFKDGLYDLKYRLNCVL